MDSFSKIETIEDYGYFKWHPVEKNHIAFTRDDVMKGLGDSLKNPVNPPEVNREIFK